jgi:hypothetical protein
VERAQLVSTAVHRQVLQLFAQEVSTVQRTLSLQLPVPLELSVQVKVSPSNLIALTVSEADIVLSWDQLT